MSKLKPLLEIARKAIEFAFENKQFVPDAKIQKQFSKNQACFVTLKINNELRGCIGSLQANKALWKDVCENATHAAFHDTRFPQLEKQELSRIKIEVSVLSLPKKLEFKTEDELLRKINPKMGLILKQGFYNATFLPQVWEELPDKISFLEHLSIKAGLNKNAWKNSNFEYYFVDAIKEN